MEFPLPSVGGPAETMATLAVGTAAVGSIGLVHRALAGVRIRVRVRRPVLPRPFARVLSLAGVTFAFASGPAVAGTRPPVSPDRRPPDAAPPWSEAGGFPPPRPLARIEAEPTSKTSSLRTRPETSAVSLQRVVHRDSETVRGRGASERMFPRQARADVDPERAAAMQRHPSGKAPRRHHHVRAGDSLWSIAEEVLGTEDPRAVARYWPQIHRANRATIGPDPSLIRPGQVLELPDRG